MQLSWDCNPRQIGSNFHAFNQQAILLLQQAALIFFLFFNEKWNRTEGDDGQQRKGTYSSLSPIEGHQCAYLVSIQAQNWG